jgi:hypothetical protein
MQLRPVIAIFFIVTCFMAGCSGNANQYIIEDVEYSDSNASISILTIDLDYLFDDFPDHEFGALRPAEQSVFQQQLVSLLSTRTTTPVLGKLNGTTFERNRFELRSFSTKDGRIELLSPEEGAVLTDSETDSRYTLILDQFYFTPYQVQIGGGSYAGHEGTTESRLRFDTNYLIWDNDRGTAIAWGKINSDARLSLQNQNRTYRNLILDAFGQIIRVSPFPASITA